MSRKRRAVKVEDHTAWVFNRMAEVYDARPAYPTELVEAVAALAPGQRILDLGAGTGHIALPLAARGFDVVALEPASAMLTVLTRSAQARGLTLELLHARAETLPFEPARFDLVVIADALHFLDAELTGAELCRVLAPRGRLAVILCEFANTPFMGALRGLMEDAAPRRPREIGQAMRHLGSLSRAPLRLVASFIDHTPVEPARLERILRSISFIGPAMNAARFEAFRQRLHGLSDAPVWSRELTLYEGLRSSRP